ncbi:MAG: response regulator transcription factor [Mycobacteriaceae bacterium]
MSTPAAHVLVADDDPVVRDVVRRYLERDGLRVTVVGDGAAALRAVSAGSSEGGIDLVVLDVMMPEVDGVEVCRRLRSGIAPEVRVIMLTALGEEDDRVLGLEVGADDYVTKPFSPRELALRVASVLRRTAQAHPPEVLRDGQLQVQPDAHRVLLGRSELALTVREFDLLRFLVAHPNTVYTREELLAQVWGWDFGDLSTVTVHVKRLRAKLARAGPPGGRDPVGTVWGVGYRWEPGAFEGELPC